jgi:hypothetical protein
MCRRILGKPLPIAQGRPAHVAFTTWGRYRRDQTAAKMFAETPFSTQLPAARLEKQLPLDSSLQSFPLSLPNARLSSSHVGLEMPHGMLGGETQKRHNTWANESDPSHVLLCAASHRSGWEDQRTPVTFTLRHWLCCLFSRETKSLWSSVQKSHCLSHFIPSAMS